MKRSKLSKLEDSLIEYLETKFEKDLFEACLKNIEDVANPLHFNNFAYGLRELARHILNRLSPDKEVMKCSWYIKMHSTPTRGQKVQYAIHGGISETFIKNELGFNIIPTKAKTISTIETLNKFTHVNEETFNLDSEKIEEYVEEMILAFVGLFKAIQECRNDIVIRLEEKIDDGIIDKIIGEEIEALTEIAPRARVMAYGLGDLKVINIDSQNIHIHVEGSIDCEFQYGSSSDINNDDGLELETSFPFTCQVYGEVDQIEDFSPEVDSLHVDTSSWFEGWTEE